MIYLYLKTHNKTGLKYLGKTTKDPYRYKGSGKYWTRHIKIHGYDVTTEILAECNDTVELRAVGEYYSLLFNIVENPMFANLRPESGDGGDTSQTPAYKAYMQTNKPHRHKNKTYEEIFGPELARDLKHQRSLSNKKRGPRDTSTRNKISLTRQQKAKRGELVCVPPKQDLITCPHCGKITNYGNAHRWHLDKCKFRY